MRAHSGSRARCSPHPIPGAALHPVYQRPLTVDLHEGLPVDNFAAVDNSAVLP